MENKRFVDGYYWMKYKGKWIIDEYSETFKDFSIIGNDCGFREEDFDETGKQVKR